VGSVSSSHNTRDVILGRVSHHPWFYIGDSCASSHIPTDYLVISKANSLHPSSIIFFSQTEDVIV